MAKRENEHQGDLPLGTPAHLVLPACLGGFKLENFEEALKNASDLLSCDVKKASFDQIVAKRGDFALVFGVKGFEVEIDEGHSTVTITEEEDEPEPPLTPQHAQPRESDEGGDLEDEADEESDEGDGTPGNEPDSQQDDGKDEDPQAQKAREWNIYHTNNHPRRRR